MAHPYHDVELPLQSPIPIRHHPRPQRMSTAPRKPVIVDGLPKEDGLIMGHFKSGANGLYGVVGTTSQDLRRVGFSDRMWTIESLTSDIAPSPRHSFCDSLDLKMPRLPHTMLVSSFILSNPAFDKAFATIRVPSCLVHRRPEPHLVSLDSYHPPFRIEQKFIEEWTCLEENIIRLETTLRDSLLNRPAPVPVPIDSGPSPRDYGYMQGHSTKPDAMNALHLSRAAFLVKAASLSLLLLLHRVNSTFRSRDSYFQHLYQHLESATGIPLTRLQDIIGSRNISNWSQPRQGAVIDLTVVMDLPQQAFLASLIEIVAKYRLSIPFCLSYGELCRHPVEKSILPSYALASSDFRPGSDEIQFLSQTSTYMPFSTWEYTSSFMPTNSRLVPPVQARDESILAHWKQAETHSQFMRRRASVNAGKEQSETSADRAARLARAEAARLLVNATGTMHLPAQDSRVFSWRRQNDELVRVAELPASYSSLWEKFCPSERHYDPFRDEWDLCRRWDIAACPSEQDDSNSAFDDFDEEERMDFDDTSEPINADINDSLLEQQMQVDGEETGPEPEPTLVTPSLGSHDSPIPLSADGSDSVQSGVANSERRHSVASYEQGNFPLFNPSVVAESVSETAVIAAQVACVPSSFVDVLYQRLGIQLTASTSKVLDFPPNLNVDRSSRILSGLLDQKLQTFEGLQLNEVLELIQALDQGVNNDKRMLIDFTHLSWNFPPDLCAAPMVLTNPHLKWENNWEMTNYTYYLVGSRKKLLSTEDCDILITPHAATVFEISRGSWGSSVTASAEQLALQGIPFRLCRLSSSNTSLSPLRHTKLPCAPRHVLRELSSLPDLSDYDAYVDLRSKFLKDRVAHAIEIGGIVGRLARELVPWHTITHALSENPPPEAVQLLEAPGGLVFSVRHFTEMEIYVICGMFTEEIENNCTQRRSWWPTPWTWAKAQSRHWTSSNESWYQGRLSQLQSKSVDRSLLCKTAKDWAAVTNGWMCRKAHKQYERIAAEYIKMKC